MTFLQSFGSGERRILWTVSINAKRCQSIRANRLSPLPGKRCQGLLGSQPRRTQLWFYHSIFNILAVQLGQSALTFGPSIPGVVRFRTLDIACAIPPNSIMIIVRSRRKLFLPKKFKRSAEWGCRSTVIASRLNMICCSPLRRFGPPESGLQRQCF